MTAKGLKRKLSAEDEEIGPAWEHQRQSVLDISIEKFQRDLSLIEPSLRRSVLIANTLRQIQSEELRCSDDLDGGTVFPAKSLPPPSPPPSPMHQPVLPSIPCLHGSVQPFLAVEGSSFIAEDSSDDWMATSLEDEFSLSTAISTILKELDGEGSQDGRQPYQATQRAPLGSIENIPGCLSGKPKSYWSGPREDECRRHLEESTMGVSCPTNLHDIALDSILFDMDMPVLEREMGVLGPRGLPSTTINSEELMKFLPSRTGSLPSSVTLSSQGTKEIHELEHIMEILVES